MENVIVVAILAVIVVAAVLYIVKEKKSGKKCIGCPYATQCGAKKCSCQTKKEHNCPEQ